MKIYKITLRPEAAVKLVYTFLAESEEKAKLAFMENEAEWADGRTWETLGATIEEANGLHLQQKMVFAKTAKDSKTVRTKRRNGVYGIDPLAVCLFAGSMAVSAITIILLLVKIFTG